MPSQQVFLSFNSEDRERAREICRYLRDDYHLDVWFDEDELAPGRRWLPKLQDSISRVGSVVILIGRGGFGPFQGFELETVLMRGANRSDFLIIPVFLPGCTRESMSDLPPFLKLYGWINMSDGIDSGCMRRLVGAIRGEKPDQVPRLHDHVMNIGRKPTGQRKKRVMILHAWADRNFKDDINNELTVRLEGLRYGDEVHLEPIDDRQVFKGDELAADFLEKKLESAAMTICLLSKCYLESKLNRGKVQTALADHAEKGMNLLAVLVEDCAVESEDWLSDVPFWPPDGLSLDELKKRVSEQDGKSLDKAKKRASDETQEYNYIKADQVYTSLASIIRELLEDRIGRPSRFRASRPAPKDIDLEDLPQTGREHFGRTRQIAEFREYWNDPRVRVILIVGDAGRGKTAFLNHCLTELRAKDFGGACKVFGRSFFSQVKPTQDQPHGSSSTSETRLSAADELVDKALRFFTGRESSEIKTESSRFKGERLGIKLMGYDRKDRPGELTEEEKERRKWFRRGSRANLLVLDALEPLQFIDGEASGRIADPAVSALWEVLTDTTSPERPLDPRVGAGRNPGLCVIATRVRPPDLPDEGVGTVKVITMDDPLEPEAGRNLLRLNRIEGDDFKLDGIVQKIGSFPLPLSLLAAYLRHCARPKDDFEKISYGKIAKCLPPQKMDDPREGVRWVLEVLQKELSGPQLEFMQMLALYDRPMSKHDLDWLLRMGPAIDGLTTQIKYLTGESLRVLVDELRELRLVLPCSSASGSRNEQGRRRERPPRQTFSGDSPAELGPNDGDDAIYPIDVHSEIRGYFMERVRKCPERPALWERGHRVLYDYWKNEAENPRNNGKSEAESLYQRIEKLFRAVVHGCLAGDHDKVWDEVFWEKIRHRFDHFSGNHLGLWSRDRVALSNFFERQWDTPARNLTKHRRVLAFNEACYDLWALGQLAAAEYPGRRCIEECLAGQDRDWDHYSRWMIAANAAGNLSKVLLPLGKIDEAVDFARKGIDWVKRGQEDLERAWRNESEKDRRDSLKAKLNELNSWMVPTIVWLADALWYSGRFWESEAAFKAAEALEQEYKARRLVETSAIRFCHLLMDQAKLIGKRWVASAGTGPFPLGEDGFAVDELQAAKALDLEVHRRFDEVLARVESLAVPSGEERSDMWRRHADRDLRLMTGLLDLTRGRARLLLGNFHLDLVNGLEAWRGRYKKEVHGHDGNEPRALREDLKQYQWQATVEIHQAKEDLHHAVQHLEKQGHHFYHARALLLRAGIHRALARLERSTKSTKPTRTATNSHKPTKDAVEDYFRECEADLKSALALSIRDGMRLFEADYHLERGRMYLERYRHTLDSEMQRRASLSLTDAEALIQMIGYGRRTLEVAELKRAVDSALDFRVSYPA
jgi:hypothetical protein